MKPDENSHVMVEFKEGSKTLIIFFGGMFSGLGIPPYEFARISGVAECSRIFIRDVHQNWYQSGFGDAVGLTESVEFLKSLIKQSNAERVVMVGNSMGGFAALMFSMLVGNSSAIAFSPQTVIDPFGKLRLKDLRWKKMVLKMYIKTLFQERILDLSKISPKEGWGAHIHVSSVDILDVKNADFLCENLPNISLSLYPFGGHDLIKELKQRGDLVDLFRSITEDNFS